MSPLRGTVRSPLDTMTLQAVPGVFDLIQAFSLKPSPLPLPTMTLEHLG